MPSSNEHKVAVDVRKHFFKKKFIKYLVLHHVLNIKKGIFSRKMITKHEQNAVKCGLNIITARDVKMR